MDRLRDQPERALVRGRHDDALARRRSAARAHRRRQPDARGLHRGRALPRGLGAPRTPVVGSFYDTTEGRAEPVFGAQNSTRLPAFYELDLRAEKALAIGPVTLRLSLDVLNVTYRKNVEEVGYSFDFSQRRYITGLPILAVLGARLEL